MALFRKRTIGLIILGITLGFVVLTFSAKAGFWQDIFSAKDNNKDKEKSIFDFGSLDSDSDGLSDKKEYELGTNPYNSDSDEDGYVDGEEIRNSHDPLKKEKNDLVDSDSDGLSGEDEKKYGTNPQKQDSDYDGYSDGMEIISGHDPLKADFSFLKPIINKAEEVKAENSNSDNTSSIDNSAPEKIEKILNAKNFSEITPESLSSLGLDSSKLDFEKNVTLSEIPNERIKISDNVSKEFMQDYFNILGIILYSNSPVRSMDEAESYAQGINISNPSQVEEMKKIVSKINKELGEMEVPAKEEFINFHKKVLSSAATLESLISSLKDINYSKNEAFYSTINLLPKFSGLSDIIFSDVVPTAEKLAQDNGCSLPDRGFLDKYK